MKIIICFAALLTLSACDSGTWADAMGAECKNGKPAGLVSDPGWVKLGGQATCAGRQKNFTGDVRCEGDRFQFKCK